MATVGTGAAASAYAAATAVAVLPYAVAAGEVVVAAGEVAADAVVLTAGLAASAAAGALQGISNLGGLLTGRLEVVTDVDGENTIVETGRGGGGVVDTLNGLGP